VGRSMRDVYGRNSGMLKNIAGMAKLWKKEEK
jgi:hypothetical protein